MTTYWLYPAPRTGKLGKSRLTMETLSVADATVALCQLFGEVLSAWSQIHNITACEDTKTILHDLITLQSILEGSKNLVMPADNKEEAQDRSEYLSASMRDELQKLIRMSDAFLESSERFIHQKRCKEQPGTMGLPLECQDIRVLILQWMMFHVRITQAGNLPPEQTRELETRNVTITSPQTVDKIALKDHDSGLTVEMQPNYEKNLKHGRINTFIVGGLNSWACGAVVTDKLRDPVAQWSCLSGPRCTLDARVEVPWFLQRGFLERSRSSGVLVANRLGAISVGTAKADLEAGSRNIFGHKSPDDDAEMHISSTKAPWPDLNGVIYSCQRAFGTSQLVRGKGIHCVARCTVDFITAAPVILLGGICAFCMHSYARNRHGQPPDYPTPLSRILYVVNNPSPPLLVAATFGHGISTLVYYYLRSADRFQECFIGAGIAVASILGLSSGIDMESLLLGAIPIVITTSLLLCTIANAFVKGFGVSVCQRQSPEFDLEKQDGS